MKRLKIRTVFCMIMLISCIASAPVCARSAVIKPGLHSRLIWFGDSRTFLFGKAVYGYQSGGRSMIKKHVVAKRGACCSWASGTGYTYLKKRLKARPNSVVIFNFGVNDLGRGYHNNSRYLKLVKKIHRSFPKATMCFMTVNPVKANSRNPYSKSRSAAANLNRKIASFNSYMRKKLPAWCVYINTNRNVAFQYQDGLHYTNGTSRKISRYVTGKKRLDN